MGWAPVNIPAGSTLALTCCKRRSVAASWNRSRPPGRSVKLAYWRLLDQGDEGLLNYQYVRLNLGCRGGVGRDADREHRELGIEVTDGAGVSWAAAAAAPPRWRSSTDSNGDPDPWPAQETNASIAVGGRSLRSSPFAVAGVGPGGSMCRSARRGAGISRIVSRTGPKLRSGETIVFSSSGSPWCAISTAVKSLTARVAPGAPAVAAAGAAGRTMSSGSTRCGSTGARRAGPPRPGPSGRTSVPATTVGR